MRLFKFRPPEAIEYGLDIILNQRLYCAEPSQLNDPMEGLFHVTFKPEDGELLTEADNVEEVILSMKRHAKQIASDRDKYRICSLTRTMNSRLMWSHYTNGFRGFAVEIEVDDNDISEVTYTEMTALYEATYSSGSETPEGAGKEVLTLKADDWVYEEEYRIIQEHQFYNLPQPPLRVITGHRMSVAALNLIKTVCEPREIRVDETHVTDSGVNSRRIDLTLSQ